jgi:hypothetical protein
LAKVAQMVDGTYTMVQLRTPVVPSMMIRPNTAAFEPERFTPVEDARITRNTFGALRPDAVLRECDTVDRAFTVTAADPSFARDTLTDEVVALLTSVPWFRVREIALHNGSLYATESGSLTEERMSTGARNLARLAALMPWEDDEFRVKAIYADTTGGGDTSLRAKVNRRRDEAGRQPVSALSLLVRTTMALVLLLAGLSSAINALAALTGLAPEVAVTVTQSYDAGDATCDGCTDLIDGEYEQDGLTHEIDGMWWMSFSRLPDRGETVDVAIGPLWWHPYIEHADAEVFMVLLSLLPLAAGGGLAKATFRPRQRGLRRTPVA